jgi:RimJ/RimL family protein N-acetyltransferase
MEIIIREAKPSDSEQLIAYVQRLSQEPESNIELAPGEFTLTVADEEKILKDYALSDNSVYLVAEIEEKIIGVLSCTGKNRQAVRHVTTLSMSVDKTWRGKGVGNQLMAKAIEWARSKAILSRIELFVFKRNERAIHLYQKFGFEIEGQKRKAIFRDDEYLDDLIMGLLL